MSVVVIMIFMITGTAEDATLATSTVTTAERSASIAIAQEVVAQHAVAAKERMEPHFARNAIERRLFATNAATHAEVVTARVIQKTC